jgi:2-polyprenyl-6-methoxyphenol hydroxylase-like FAD-dependent oxidoreductase
MARVAMIGGGVVGLCGAMLLAQDGHEVTVVERDAAPPCPPADAWANWDRRGVNQFRQGHFLLPPFRRVIDAELPDVAAGLESAGALRYNTLAAIPAEMTGGMRTDDDRFELLTARRPVLEAVVAQAADDTAGCTVRRGAAVRALRVRDGRVGGVDLDDGTALDADVVIDAGGRRSPVGDLVEQAGLKRPAEDRHDYGFVYYGRHYRSADGSVPFAFGPLLQAYESLSVGTLPADNGHWAIIVVTSGRDRAARALRDVEKWEQVVRSYPMVAHWLDGEPVEESISVMAAIEDRVRHFCLDGVPVAPGLLPLGDAYACTNPSVGRGASIGLKHAVALRDLLQWHPTDDAVALSCAWDDATERSAAPFVRATLDFDGHRLAEIDAQIAGVPYAPDDPDHDRLEALFAHGRADPDLLRGIVDIMAMNECPVDVFARPGFAARVAELDAAGPRERLPGISRAELVALLEA